LSVLLGDVLFAHALNLATDFDDTRISRTIARTATEVCSGEMIQTQRRFDLHLSREEYFRIIGMKTGSLFACASELGAVINGAPEGVVRRLRNFGAHIGTAYQIYDDCLDVAGNETETGKTLGTDLRKGKLTLPVLALLESASAFDREHAATLVLEGKLEEVTALLESAPADGGLNAAITTALDFIRQAETELAALAPNEYVDALFGLGDALRELLEPLRS
jgi:octaprenyl-diphosphate synthase